MTMRRIVIFCASISMLAASACTQTVEEDLSAFETLKPRSILVLPPLNESVDVNAPYNWLSTISMPLGEAGYYVFPVAVIDAYMKDNGLPTPDEMHNVSLAKLREVIGPDAVLYVTIEDWGQKYQVLSSTTVVRARARLVHTASGTEIWTGSAVGVEGSGASNDLVGALITAAIAQVLESTSDSAHDLARRANAEMVFNDRRGFAPGPYSHDYAPATGGATTGP
jgi:hypothetical protein